MISRTKQSLAAEQKFLNKIAEKGGKALSDYKSAREKVTISCKNGHIFQVSPHHVNSDGQWCKDCPSEETLEIMNTLFRRVGEKRGSVLGQFIKAKDPILLQCEHGHQWKTTPTIICKTERWCRECEKIQQIPYETIVRNTIQYRGGILIGPYSHTPTSKILIQCQEFHNFEMTPGNILLGNWCKNCSKYSSEAFKSKLQKIIAEKEGELIDSYINSRTPITVRCHNSHIWNPYPGHIVNDNSWCPLCPTAISLKAQEDFMQILTNKGGNLLSDYVNNDTKVRIRCHRNHQWNVTPHSVKSMNSWCPFCSDNSPEQAALNFYAKVNEKGGIPLDTYKGAYTRVPLQCKNSHIWKAVPHSIISNDSWCAKCYGNCPEQARDKFYQTISEKKGEALESYINSWTRVKIRCMNNHEWDAIPGSVNYGDWCRACNGTCPKEAYKNLCEIVADHKGQILEDYVNSVTKIAFKCKNGHIFRTCPTNIMSSGTWCPSCNESHGERAVRRILEKHNITFEPQIQHPSLPGYYFDFYFTLNDVISRNNITLSSLCGFN